MGGKGLIVTAACLFASAALAEEKAAPEPAIKWSRGPGSIDLGTLAAMDLPKDTAFAGPADAQFACRDRKR